MELLCAFCIIVRPKDVSKAVTIVSGHAVCFDHTYHIQGGAFAKALEQIKIDEGFTKLKVDLIGYHVEKPFIKQESNPTLARYNSFDKKF